LLVAKQIKTTGHNSIILTRYINIQLPCTTNAMINAIFSSPESLYIVLGIPDAKLGFPEQDFTADQENFLLLDQQCQ